MDTQQRHLLMSVTKSFVGTVVAELISQGKLDENGNIDKIVPALKGTPLGSTTVRQALDMTAGMKYSEDYADPNADVWSYISSIGLKPPPDDNSVATNIMDYLKDMKAGIPTGEIFNYVTPMSEVSQAVVVTVEGKQFNKVKEIDLAYRRAAETEQRLTQLIEKQRKEKLDNETPYASV